MLPSRREVLLGLPLVLAHAPARAASAPFQIAEIVFDVTAGRVVHRVADDVPIMPASLAKLMTLELLFSDIEAGRILSDAVVPVSMAAAARPNTKLGLQPGESIPVAAAAVALAVHSCNDVATALAERLSGTEAAFAVRMTERARAMGMASTTFGNASGLPDPANVSTARDLALLGATLMARHPSFWPVLGIRQWIWRGHVFENTNRLLGVCPGMEAGKTGHVTAAGFHLFCSATRRGRRAICVVIGYPTTAARDARVWKLLDETLGPG